MKLWLDDIRDPPDSSWLVATTADQAIAHMKTAREIGDPFIEASLDHDLGHCVACTECKGWGSPCGCRCHLSGNFVVNWMATEGVWPERVRIHSMNPGARRNGRVSPRVHRVGCRARARRGEGSMTREFPKSTLVNLAWGEPVDGYNVVEDEITGKSRWSIEHTMVFRAPDGRLYQVGYRVGATESQEEGPFEHAGESVACVEVEAYEVAVTRYRPVSQPRAGGEP